ncbi:MAG: hypothetical protein KAJ29_07305 [Alphaproteobacteria bacterium]|nr:hypothetical protein [Alphaproteobacteria bacterium]
MATLKQAVSNEKILKFKAKIDVGELENRCVYVSQEAHKWCFSSKQLGEKTPNPSAWKDVNAVLSEFVEGQNLLLGSEIRRLLLLPEIKRLRHVKDDIWEIKTKPPDAVRIFGWFYKQNIFIVSHCEYRKNLKSFKAYQPHIKKVIDFSDELGFFRERHFKWSKNEKEYFKIN